MGCSGHLEVLENVFSVQIHLNLDQTKFGLSGVVVDSNSPKRKIATEARLYQTFTWGEFTVLLHLGEAF